MEKIGSDIFVTVSPRGISVFVADADVITQVAMRRHDFPKPQDLYQAFELYVRTLILVEGERWRAHRKLMSVSFSEKNNELIWNETMHYAGKLCELWLGPEGKGNVTVEDPVYDFMQLAVYAISCWLRYARVLASLGRARRVDGHK